MIQFIFSSSSINKQTSILFSIFCIIIITQYARKIFVKKHVDLHRCFKNKHFSIITAKKCSFTSNLKLPKFIIIFEIIQKVYPNLLKEHLVL